MRSIAIVMLLAACVPEEVEGETEATGTAMYRDAGTTSDGTMTRDPDAVPEQPNADPMRVFVEVEGTGTFDVGDPQCEADELTGAFQGLLEGDAEIDEDGVYFAAMGEGDFETPSGCTIPSLSIGVVTGVVVRGELAATTQNCDTYCTAKARSVAESECDGNADEAGCRAAAEATYEASCTTSCTSTTHVIVAETSLGASALGGLDLLGGSALGTIEADLEFDHVEDSSGQTVSETQ